MGWHTQPGGLMPRLLRGIGLGALMAMLATGLAFVIDRATVRYTGDWSLWPRVVLPLAIGLVLAALGEELMFRGYPLRRLADAIGPLPAMLILAVLFGLAHAGNDNATVFSTVNVALAAIWLSFAFFSTGGMALAWGLHFGWNAGLSILFDAPVSGNTFLVPAVEYTPGRHAWVDGGSSGPVRCDPRVEYVLDPHHGDRQADQPAGAGHRHAFHESGSPHETRRGNTWTRDVERNRQANPRNCKGIG